MPQGLPAAQVSAYLYGSYTAIQYCFAVLRFTLQVLLANYLAQPANYLTSIPAASEVVTEKTLSARTPNHAADAIAASSGPTSGGGSPSAALSGGAIAGIVIGVLAGLAIIASLAYFVGYKRFYQVHRATSFRKGVLPEGPGFNGAGTNGAGPYPAAAYGAQPQAPGFDIETPAAALRTNGNI